MTVNGDRSGLTKFSRQAADLGAVYLYKEGLFVRAYNEGAYAFVHHILACKPMRRFVKSAGDYRVVCGVPLSTLQALPGFAEATQVDALTWRWPLASPVDPASYQIWRDGLPLMPDKAGEVASRPKPANKAQHLVDQLLSFNLATNTPMAALNLVAELQRQWQESEVA